jgi:hypothetical protein
MELKISFTISGCDLTRFLRFALVAVVFYLA